MYLGKLDSGSGHIVFKLNTKVGVSVNRVVVVPTSPTVVHQVNQMEVLEIKLDGIQFTNMDGRVTKYDLHLSRDDDDDDDSNASDEILAQQ